MRPITSFILFVILTGLMVRFSLQPTWLAWVGQLPGDITVNKGAISLYFPLTSSLLATLCLSLLSFLLFRSRE